MPEPERKRFTRQYLLWAAAAVVLGLVLTGRAPWVMGVLAAILALAGRMAQLAQFAPLFKKLFGDDAQAGQNSSGQGSAGDDSSEQQAQFSQTMTRQQAADFLGVDINASRDEIRQAHKKLMQKIHPDRGGSDALAKQINLAKDLLLK